MRGRPRPGLGALLVEMLLKVWAKDGREGGEGGCGGAEGWWVRVSVDMVVRNKEGEAADATRQSGRSAVCQTRKRALPLH